MASSGRRRKTTAWIALGCAAIWLFWSQGEWVRRVDYVSALPGRAAELRPGVAVGTGSLRNQRDLVVPLRNEESFHWIIRTQQRLAEHTGPVRRAEYENAPGGVPVRGNLPYGDWFGAVARIDGALTGRPVTQAVEHAARYVEPLLQVLAFALLAACVGTACGLEVATLVALGFAGIFPFTSLFVAAAPDHHGLACVGASASVALLLIAFVSGRGGNSGGRSAVWWSTAAGVIGGFGLWLSAGIELPVLVAVALGGAASLGVTSAGNAGDEVSRAGGCWRAWALAGAAVVLAASFMEHTALRPVEWQWDAVNPGYAVAWAVIGELLAWAQRSGAKLRWRGETRDRILVAGGVGAVALTGWGWHVASGKLMAREIYWVRLSLLGGGDTAANPFAQLLHGTPNGATVAALAPLLVLVPTVLLLVSRRTPRATKSLLVLGLVPVVVLLGLSLGRASEWNVLDAVLLALWVPVGLAALAHACRWAAALAWGAAAVGAGAGMVYLGLSVAALRSPVLDATEAEELIERDLAHSLARRAGFEAATVFAPPSTTTTLAYFGGFRGIGTFDVDNQSAIEGTLRIAGASSMMEAQELITARGVKFLVLPSWDAFFADYARLYAEKNLAAWQSGFLAALATFDLPPWLRPVPYDLPTIKGYEDRSVLVFEVVPDQNPATALARTVEYLIERGDLARAQDAARHLQRFPGDLNATVALAELQAALNQPAEFEATFAMIANRLAEHADRRMPWDRRVALATVLVRGKSWTAAQEQVRLCLAQANPEKLRSISTASLSNLLVVSRGFGIQFPNEADRQFALSLLSPELRQHFEAPAH